MSNSVRPHRRQPTRLLCPWDFPGKSTGVGCHCLLRKHLHLWQFATAGTETLYAKYTYIVFTLNFLLVSKEEKKGENDAPQSAMG